MATCYVPEVGEDAYESLRQRYPRGFPDGFKVWRFKHDQSAANWMASEHKVVRIAVNADDFVRHCDQTKSACTADELDRFAGWVGLGGIPTT